MKKKITKKIDITVNGNSFEIDASEWPSGVYIVNYGTPIVMGKVVRLVKL